MGSGGLIMKGIVNLKALNITIGIFFLRFFLTGFAGTGSVTGGLVVPCLTIGSLIGNFIFLLLNKTVGFDSSYQEITCLISATMFLSFIIKSPFTGIALVYSTIFYATKDFLLAFHFIPYLIITYYLGVMLIHKIFKIDNLYDEQVKLADAFNKNTLRGNASLWTVKKS